MNQTHQNAPTVIPPIILQDHFAETFSKPFKAAKDRLLLAHEQYGDQLVLSSSFGVQSIILIEAIVQLREEYDINIPIIRTDQPELKYDRARDYAEKLQRLMGFDLYVARAYKDDNADKNETLERGLKTLRAKAVVFGVRTSQTKTRQNKGFIEARKDGRVALHPLLDYSDERVQYSIENTHPEYRHPLYAPGVEMIGGAPLAKDEVKRECGLHVSPDYQI